MDLSQSFSQDCRKLQTESKGAEGRRWEAFMKIGFLPDMMLFSLRVNAYY